MRRLADVQLHVWVWSFGPSRHDGIQKTRARLLLLRSRTAIPMSCNVTAQSGGLIMSDSGWGSSGGAWRSDGGVPSHAFDPWLQPELFRGVLTRRVFAFLIDIVVLAIPVILACLFIVVFGVVTLGLGWALFWLGSPASGNLALVYLRPSPGGAPSGH